VAVFGSLAFGLVMGWVCVLVGRGTGRSGVSWRTFAFVALALLGTVILAFFYVGLKGILMSLVAFGVGALAARTVLGARAVPATDQKGG
jgi:hypothetical protein